jgi:hypothetical protein
VGLFRVVSTLDGLLKRLQREPAVALFLVVEMPNAGDTRRVAVLLRPLDCFLLYFERREHLIVVVLNDVGNLRGVLWVEAQCRQSPYRVPLVEQGNSRLPIAKHRPRLPSLFPPLSVDRNFANEAEK